MVKTTRVEVTDYPDILERIRNIAALQTLINVEDLKERVSQTVYELARKVADLGKDDEPGNNSAITLMAETLRHICYLDCAEWLTPESKQLALEVKEKTGVEVPIVSVTPLEVLGIIGKLYASAPITGFLDDPYALEIPNNEQMVCSIVSAMKTYRDPAILGGFLSILERIVYGWYTSDNEEVVEDLKNDLCITGEQFPQIRDQAFRVSEKIQWRQEPRVRDQP